MIILNTKLIIMYNDEKLIQFPHLSCFWNIGKHINVGIHYVIQNQFFIIMYENRWYVKCSIIMLGYQ